MAVVQGKNDRRQHVTGSTSTYTLTFLASGVTGLVKAQQR